MSKYLDITVYEKFTGLKPPEPKQIKSKRKKGFGHPYRMRLVLDSNTKNNENYHKNMTIPNHPKQPLSY